MLKQSAIAILLLGACASDGMDGMNGANGTDGTDGTNGTNGTDGKDGKDGVTPAGPAVYTLANQSANQVSSFLRGENGNLTRDNEYATGGAGTAAGLGSQDALAWDKKTQRFFSVNAGDNTISMLAIDEDGVLTKLASAPSGGTKPVSIAVHDGVVYVLNYGTTTAGGGNITGFTFSGNALTPIPNSTQALSGSNDVHPTDIVFTPDGKFLVVAERFGATAAHIGKLDTYAVVGGVAQAGNFQVSAGNEPFAIAFSPEGFMLVAEVGNEMADGSSVSSYSISATGTLTPVTSALPTHQGAACWIVSAGGFAYIANTATSTITGVNVGTDGKLTLERPSGATVASGQTPIDLAVSPERGYLYSLAGGSHTINIYSINSDGSLTAQPALSGMPAGASGLVAR